METKRRQYSEEFKKEAVEYSLSSGKTVEKVAQDLGISPHTPEALSFLVPQSTRNYSVLRRCARYSKFPGQAIMID